MKRLCLILTLCSLVVMLTPVVAQNTTTGAVKGTVTHAGIPLEGVRVVVDSTDGVEHETLTDSKGEFNIAGLTPRRYLMSFTKEGYERRADKPITVTAGGIQYISRMMSKKGEMAIAMVDPALNAEIMSKTGIVRGMVLDTSPFANPLEGVRVVAVNADGIEHETLTDSNGEYEIIHLPPGRYLMNFTKYGYKSRVGKPITAAAGGDQYVQMEMSKMGTIRGSVTDTSSLQNPLEGVRVVAVNPAGIEYETQTESNGQYVIIGLPPGRYLMNFTKAGYGDRLGKPMTVSEGGDVSVAMKMSKKASFGSFLKRLFGGEGTAPSKTAEEEPGSHKHESGSLIWLLIIGLVIVAGVVIIGRRNRRSSE